MRRFMYGSIAVLAVGMNWASALEKK